MLIDRYISEQRPDLSSAQSLAELERVPFRERILAVSTYQAIGRAAALVPESNALVFLPTASVDDVGHTISYRDFYKKVTQSANLFHSLGVGKNDVVSFLLPLVPQSFYSLFGAEAAGIANPVNALLEPHQLAEILQAAKTRVLVVWGGGDIWEKVQRLRSEYTAQLTSLQHVVVVGHPTGATGADIDFDVAIAACNDIGLDSGRVFHSDDVAAYFHTGGTTGTPKLVAHTHENQVYQAWVCNLMLPGMVGGHVLFGLPLYHVGGALTQCLSALTGGSTVVILSPAGWRHPNAVRQVWSLVGKYRPIVLGAVPTVLAAAAGMPIGDADVSSVKVVSGGGSAIPVAIGQRLSEQLSAPVLEVYGMTETASVHTISYLDRPVRLGSVGHAVPYSRVRVVKLDAQGQTSGVCAPNEIGVVVMAGPGVFRGYLDQVHNQGAFAEPGWVNSGDLGRLDQEGYLWITGRAKDLIIRGGHNIDPMPIEELLYQHPAVALAAVIGQPDAYAGELPVAYVQLKQGERPQTAELLEHVRAKTPERAAVPVQVIAIDAMPLTGVGKVFKPQLRWQAIDRVFSDTLQPIAQQLQDQHQATMTIHTGADGTHGTLAIVRIIRSGDKFGAAEREAVTEKIASVLAPFTVRHTCEFA